MELQELYSVISELDASSRDDLFRFIQCSSMDSSSTLHSRKEQLDNKQGYCPHCQSTKYVKSGVDKGSQRYKCKGCNRTFTEYTGTWLAGIVHKDKVEEYFKMMLEEKSLDKIKDKLKINKKTAFDWRHKILSAIEDSDDDEPFSGITESDETFFKLSSKGKNTLERPSRKRGGENKIKGVSNELVGVVVTSDRADNLDLQVATIGRLTKQAIIHSIGNKINSETILCSDGHVSYKGFAIDNELEHHVLRGDLKQRVKQGIYHIQNVNSIHNRLKKWIDNVFWGVSTKYLQKYLNWFRLKEKLKKSANALQEFAKYVNTSQKALERYKNIDYQYLKLIT